MSELNKFGEIEEKRVCTQCKKTIEASWVVCPHCGHSLDSVDNPSSPKHGRSVNEKHGSVSRGELFKWATSAIGLRKVLSEPDAMLWAMAHEYFFDEYDFKLFKRLHIYAMSLGGSLGHAKTAADWVIKKMLEAGPEASEETIKTTMIPPIEKKRGCFISTAVTSSLNLPDDCHELTILRRFRDTYMNNDPKRQQEVEEYYRIAPGIVESISRHPDASDIWRGIWTSHLAPAIAAIECGNDDGAYSIYCDMVKSLSHLIKPVNLERL